MPYKPSHVANSFLNQARQEGVKDVDQLKIQKLCYFMNGWHLATRGSPVVGERFEAWPYGPVLSSLYHEFKGNGSKPIDGWAIDIDPATGGNKALMVNLKDKNFYDIFIPVWEKYKIYPGLVLSSMTHMPGSPWDKARKAGSAYLDENELRSYFLKMAQTGVKA